MSSVKSRENTFRVDFSNLPKRMTYEEIHAFVYHNLGLGIDAVKRLQVNHALNCAQVKCSDLRIAQETVMQHNGKHEVEMNKHKYKVKLCMDDGGVEVKIHDLSENVTNEQICDYLKQYGEVLAVKELIWGEKFIYKNAPTGTRVVKMMLRKHIKSYVTILGEKTYVSYFGQPPTCKHCANVLHAGMTCAENKKLVTQKSDLNNRLKLAQSYAGVAGGSSSTPQGQNLGEEAAAALMPVFTTLTSAQNQGKNTTTTAVSDETSVPPNAPAASPAAPLAADLPAAPPAAEQVPASPTSPPAAPVADDLIAVPMETTTAEGPHTHNQEPSTAVENALPAGQGVDSSLADASKSTDREIPENTQTNLEMLSDPSTSYSAAELAQRVEFLVPQLPIPDMEISEGENTSYTGNDTDISDLSTSAGNGFTPVKPKRKRGRPKKIRTQ